jgi:hypothetical protein
MIIPECCKREFNKYANKIQLKCKISKTYAGLLFITHISELFARKICKTQDICQTVINGTNGNLLFSLSTLNKKKNISIPFVTHFKKKTPWSWILQKLTAAQLLNKFPIFCGTRRLFIVFTIVRFWSLSWARQIQPTRSHSISK